MWCFARQANEDIERLDGSTIEYEEYKMFRPIAYWDRSGKLFQMAKGPWNAHQPAQAPWKIGQELEIPRRDEPVIVIPKGESEETPPLITLDGFNPPLPPVVPVSMVGTVETLSGADGGGKTLTIRWQPLSDFAEVDLMMRANPGDGSYLQYIPVSSLDVVVPMEDIAAAIEPPYDPRVDDIVDFIDDIKNKPCNHPESGGMSFYGWDPCYTDPETGETGRWVDATSPAAGADLPFWLRDGDSATNMGSSIGNTTDGTVIDLDHYKLVGTWSTDVLLARALSSSETISTRDLYCENIGSVSNKLAINAETTFGLGIDTASLSVDGTHFVPETLQYLKPDGTTASITVLAVL